MRPFRTLLPVACMAMMLLSVAPVSADVVWDHTLTDPADDVISVLEPSNKLDTMGEVDILSASVADQGDDINVTLTLARARNTQATYQVFTFCDGDEAKTYTFSYFSYAGFSIDGFDMVEDSPETYVSADGKKLSWVIGKDRISAIEKVEVARAESSLLSGMTNYVDTAPDAGTGGNGGGNGGGGSDEPVNVQVHIEMKELERVVQTIEVVIDGDDAKDLRGEFDTDVDGTVTRAEYDQHIEFFYLTAGSWNSTDMTLDGKGPVSKMMTFEFQGIVGSATSTSPVTQVVVLDITFPQVDEETGTHTYAGGLSGNDEAGDMWDVTADSLWHMTAPSGWKYKTDDWPAGLRTYMGGGGTTIALSGLQMQSDWNNTMGLVTSVVITEKTSGDDEEEVPGFGLVITSAGLMVGMLLAVASKRRR